MAARTPRRSFAAPFVITLAAAPACYVSPGPQQPQPVTQEQPVQPASNRPPMQPITNPPMPQAPVAANQKWSVFKQPDGACMAAEKVTCDPKMTCNPPPPFKYECPQNVSLDAGITVASNNDGTACFVEHAPMKCPPNVACNPPRPTPVTCPRR